MITGAVTGSLDPHVQLLVLDANGKEVPINFVVDTGYNGYIALPQRRIDALALMIKYSGTVTLSDGSLVESDLYEATVLWDGVEYTVPVNHLEGDPIIGTALLSDCELTIHFINGGRVKIERVP